MITDRPDFTESPVAVPRGSVQLEAGATLLTEGGDATASAPEVLLRWAPVRGAELRVGLPEYVSADGGSGLSDASLGAKLELGTAGAWAIGTILEASLPTGADGIGGAPISPLALLIVGRDLPRGMGLGAQVEAAWDRAVDAVAVGGTLVVSAPLNARLGGFLEAAGTVSSGPAEAYLHAGTTLAVTPTLQFDARLAVGLTAVSPDVQVGIGVSTRW